ncbi:hypothetical protein B0H17DRAFT_1130006 [Mycena rosella]|uniref:Uncharacterized protein n=1 Tax=Mycena rosella TaxID=1033263 RepID=A0AAD7GPL9_MYCRO|nr:hypothetical protein B0H17DRAFT_1130006 [Mycena rosella]
MHGLPLLQPAIHPPTNKQTNLVLRTETGIEPVRGAEPRQFARLGAQMIPDSAALRKRLARAPNRPRKEKQEGREMRRSTWLRLCAGPPRQNDEKRRRGERERKEKRSDDTPQTSLSPATLFAAHRDHAVLRRAPPSGSPRALSLPSPGACSAAAYLLPAPPRPRTHIPRLLLHVALFAGVAAERAQYIWIAAQHGRGSAGALACAPKSCRSRAWRRSARNIYESPRSTAVPVRHAWWRAAVARRAIDKATRFPPRTLLLDLASRRDSFSSFIRLPASLSYPAATYGWSNQVLPGELHPELLSKAAVDP